MFFGKSKIKKSRLDWVNLALIAALLILGTVSVFSAVPGQERVLRTQLLALPIAAAVFFILWNLNYQIFQDQWKILYFVMLIALLAVLFFGVSDKGAKSWFRFPFFSAQPSEFARIGLILIMANYLDKRYAKIKEFSHFFGALLICVPIFFLLMKQPDFSAILTILPVILIMLFCAGARLFHIFLFIGFTLIAGALPVLWTIIDLNSKLLDNSFIKIFYGLSQLNWHTAFLLGGLILAAYLSWLVLNNLYMEIPGIYFSAAILILILGLLSGMAVKKQMKTYQHKRIEAFLSPQTDPKGAGYNILQAQIAVGSGGLFGKGLFSGSQSKLGFIPERHTDFILAVIGENFGFMGMLAVIGLYIFLMRRILLAANLARDRFGYFACCGIFGMFMVYFMINFGMILGLFPVAGVPLPLLSYGGSNLVATMSALGIVQSVYSRRYSLR